MSQTWHLPLLTTDTLSDSRGYLNDAFAALRTKFSGSSAPSSPVQGQDFVDTDDNVWSVYNGASWTTVGDLDTAYLGLLPRSAGSSYPLTGSLYCGSYAVKAVGTPVDTTDATNKTYCDLKLPKAGGTMTGAIVMGANKVTSTRTTPDDNTEFVRKDYVDGKLAKSGGTMTGSIAMGSNSVTGLPSQSDSTPSDYAANCSYLRGKFDTSTGHDHDGGDSKLLPASSIDASAASNGAVPYVTSSAAGFVVPIVCDYNTSVTIPSSTTGYQDIAEVAIVLPSTSTKILVKVVFEDNQNPNTYARLLNGTDTVIKAEWVPTIPSPLLGSPSIDLCSWVFCPATTGSYTITLQMFAQSSSYVATQVSLVAILC
jgi:hypothetical protein